jgi:hypothetical protein
MRCYLPPDFKHLTLRLLKRIECRKVTGSDRRAYNLSHLPHTTTCLLTLYATEPVRSLKIGQLSMRFYGSAGSLLAKSDFLCSGAPLSRSLLHLYGQPLVTTEGGIQLHSRPLQYTGLSD